MTGLVATINISSFMVTGQPGFIQRTSCPACGNDQWRKVFSGSYNEEGLKKYLTDFYNNQGFIEYQYLDNVEFNLLECTRCSLVYQEYIPNDALMYRLYEHWIDPQQIIDKSKKDGYEYYKYYASEVVNILNYFDKPPHYLRVFDFGMGWGKWLMMAKAFGCQVYGTELSQERMNYARKNGITVLNWEEISSEQFDFVNTEQVFEHIPNPLETLKHLSGSLTPGGLVKISIPNGNGIGYKLRHMDWSASRKAKKSLMVVSPLEHINCFKTKSVVEMAKACGLKQIKVPVNFIAFRSAKDLVQTVIRPFYYRFFDAGSITLFFSKS